jgi:hypothetical protein
MITRYLVHLVAGAFLAGLILGGLICMAHPV